jgi:DNA-binding transcriptional MerR regulator
VSTLLKIGQVHALLRSDFPNLELSRIRYYEEQGLVLPQRSKKGYRLYSERDIACLREAIRLADEEFVLLRIIRLRLIEQGLLADTLPTKAPSKQAAKVAAQRGVSLAVPPTNVVPMLRAVPAENDDSVIALSPVGRLEDLPASMAVEEFQIRSGVSAEHLRQLIAQGLLTPGVRGREQFLRSSDLAVAQAGDALLRNGVDIRLLGGLRRVVEREVGISQDATAALRATGRNANETRAAVRATLGEISALREALLSRELDEFFSN